jgi:hypothetical protein
MGDEKTDKIRLLSFTSQNLGRKKERNIHTLKGKIRLFNIPQRKCERKKMAYHSKFRQGIKRKALCEQTCRDWILVSF